MRVVVLGLAMIGVSTAWADIAPKQVVTQSGPWVKCEHAPPSILAELERFFKTAAEHASLTKLCMDGDDSITKVHVLATCIVKKPGDPDLTIRAKYQVTVSRQNSGECSPYPQCADGGPDQLSLQELQLVWKQTAAGWLLAIPKALPGISLLTPVSRAHNTGCGARSRAFVPKPIALPK